MGPVCDIPGGDGRGYHWGASSREQRPCYHWGPIGAASRYPNQGMAMKRKEKEKARSLAAQRGLVAQRALICD